MDGTLIDAKYQVVRQLGAGGMGAVYEAKHIGTGRRVAVKVIIAEALVNGEESVVRFQREARASGAIDSQHVVQVLDTGVDPSTHRPYLVMEHLTGEDLSQLVARLGMLAPNVVLRIMAHACAGLARAHEAGIVHRDIKPANLFVAKREMGEHVTKILDFGIAKVRAESMSEVANQGITRTGAILGSPLYMSPEQAKGAKDIDARSDIFSLGVAMYQALCGVPPNDECETIGTLVIAICLGTSPPVELRAPWVSAEIAAIVAKCLAVDPAARFQSAAEMRVAIMDLLPQGAVIQESMLVAPSPYLQRTASLHGDSSRPNDVKPPARLSYPPGPQPAGFRAFVDAKTLPVHNAVPGYKPSDVPTVAGAATGTAFGATQNGNAPSKVFPMLLGVALTLSFVAVVAFVGYKFRPLAPPAPSAVSTLPTIVVPATTAGLALVTTESTQTPAASATPAPAAAADAGGANRIGQAKSGTPPVGPAVRTKASASAVTKAPNCTVPFTIEKDGTQRYKEECLP